jgi:phage baseplate assembly protein W
MPARFVGISFPFRKGGGGYPETAVDEQLVRESLEQIVLTGRFERVMRPSAGCDAQTLVFENKGPALNALIARTVLKAISENEPRVTLLDLVVEDKEDEGVLTTIVYAINGLQRDPLEVLIPR